MVAWVVVFVPEFRKANICKIPTENPMLAIKRVPADHDIQTYFLDLR